jgi:hypothetical protein
MKRSGAAAGFIYLDFKEMTDRTTKFFCFFKDFFVTSFHQKIRLFQLFQNLWWQKFYNVFKKTKIFKYKQIEKAQRWIVFVKQRN